MFLNPRHLTIYLVDGWVAWRRVMSTHLDDPAHALLPLVVDGGGWMIDGWADFKHTVV